MPPSIAAPLREPAAQDPRVLHRWLAKSRHFAPAYQGEMSNHLPMVLHAAWDLGADEHRLQAQFEHDTPRLEAAATMSTEAPPAGDWLALRGRGDAYPALFAWFESALARQSPQAVMRATLPRLLSGLHAFAFHGLIRTSHAWESGDTGELARALAAWSAWWEALPHGAPIAPADRLDPATWGRLLRERSNGWYSPQPMILRRIHDATRTPVYADMAERLSAADSVATQRDRLLTFARQAYLHSRNFTVLHMITGLRALRVLLPLAGPLDAGADLALQTALGRAVTAAWMSGRVQWSEQAHEADGRAWPELQQLALAQFDDHAIKLVHACRQEDGLRPDPRWRAVAGLALSRAPGARRQGSAAHDLPGPPHQVGA